MSMSNYLENALINAVLKNTSYTSPATIYLALYTTDPTDTDTGTEITGNGYARQPITFGAVSNGTISNSADITFPVATASWGTISHVGLRDALSAGNLLWSGALSTPQAVAVNNQLVFKSGQLSVSLD